MNWKDEPATESQLSHLRQLGCLPERPLTKGEAAHLISDSEANPAQPANSAQESFFTADRREAHRFRVIVEAAKRAATEGSGEIEKGRQELEIALAQRQQFWIDTCHDPTQMRARSDQVLDLHIKHGCRFVAPTGEQAQEILDALDFALPHWDRDQPELFYQTLELNFPELRRHT